MLITHVWNTPTCPRWILFSVFTSSLIIRMIEVTSSYPYSSSVSGLKKSVFYLTLLKHFMCVQNGQLGLSFGLYFGNPKSHPLTAAFLVGWLVSKWSRCFWLRRMSCNLALCFKRPFFQQHFLNQRREGHCQKTQIFGKLEIVEAENSWCLFLFQNREKELWKLSFWGAAESVGQRKVYCLSRFFSWAVRNWRNVSS